MRRILADIEAADDLVEIKTSPIPDQKTLKIPEPDSGNTGPTGFYGVSEFVRSRQSMDVEVARSGDYVSFRRDSGASFMFKPDYIRDGDEVEVMDEYNWTGAEATNIVEYSQTLIAYNNTVQISSPKITALKKWGQVTSAYGNIGMMVSCVWAGSGTAPDYYIWLMHEYRDHGGSPDLSYQWVRDTTLDIDAAVGTSTTVPACDLVEMDDGSIVCAAVTNDTIRVFKTFNCGGHWLLLNDFAIASDTWRIAIDRIGTRLVMVVAKDSGGVADWIFSYYSDDGGASWSSAVVVKTAARAQVVIDLDLVMGQDGILYLFHGDEEAVASEIEMQSTTDGANWTTSVAVVGSLTVGDGLPTALQQYHGRWVIYSLETAPGYTTVENYVAEGLSNPQASSGWASLGYVNENDGDAGGANVDQLCAREMNGGGFIDIVTLQHDSEGTDYYNLVVYRVNMWSGVQFDDVDWGAVWTPHAFPSTADAHPNLDAWDQTQGGDGAAAMARENDFEHLETTCGAAGGAVIEYTDFGKSGILPDESWDTGATCRFELRVDTGWAKMYMRLCADAATGPAHNKDVQFTVEFSTTQIRIWDELAGARVGDIITPTNWNPSTWNEYVLTVKGDDDGSGTFVRLYRAPSGTYREVAPYELVFETDTGLQEDAFADNFDRILWGVGDNLGDWSGASEVHWRSVMLSAEEAFFGEEWTPSSNWEYLTVGRRCHQNPVGIMQGIGCKWDGSYAVGVDSTTPASGERWHLETGAHYSAENIIKRHSPRVMWREPLRNPLDFAAADKEFEWEGKDVQDVAMSFTFNAIALFGINCPRFQLSGRNFGGGGGAELLDVDFTGGATEQLGPVIYSGAFVVGLAATNIVLVTAGTTPWEGAFVPNQYASNEYRSWYVMFTSGTCDGCIYRIIGNTTTNLMLEQNVVNDGVADPDTFIIFADRCLCLLNSKSSYSRLELLYRTDGYRPSPSEAQFKIGTVVLGMLYDLADDEWESRVTTDPAVQQEEGRGRIKQWREFAPERRSVGLAYTGMIDHGMGVHPTRELYRYLRYGVHPLVWIDDDMIFDHDSGSNPAYSHVDPILVKSSGPISQTRKFYDYREEDGVWRIRGVHDMSVSLEEVI